MILGVLVIVWGIERIIEGQIEVGLDLLLLFWLSIDTSLVLGWCYNILLVLWIWRSLNSIFCLTLILTVLPLSCLLLLFVWGWHGKCKIVSILFLLLKNFHHRCWLWLVRLVSRIKSMISLHIFKLRYRTSLLLTMQRRFDWLQATHWWWNLAFTILLLR